MSENNYFTPNRDTKYCDQHVCVSVRSYNSTNVISYLARGRIAVLSPLAAATAFVCSVCWAGPFACGRYITYSTKLANNRH